MYKTDKVIATAPIIISIAPPNLSFLLNKYIPTKINPTPAPKTTTAKNLIKTPTLIHGVNKTIPVVNKIEPSKTFDGSRGCLMLTK